MKKADAIFSDDRVYRYVLWRIWDSELPMVNIVGLNPATADEFTNDPTMRRCSAFAKSWGYGGFYMTNLFAYRTAYPKQLLKVENPIGADNDYWLNEIAARVDRVILAWGVNGTYLNRDNKVYEILKYKAYCIDKTKQGHPKHPLYLKSDMKPIKYDK
jgi:hypothetical protein